MNIAQEVLKDLKDILPTYVNSDTALHSINANEGELFFNYEDCTVYIYRDGQYHILWESRKYY